MTLSANKSITLLTLLFVFALAAVVRIESVRDELWIDEYITGWTVAESLGEAAVRARQSNQSLPYTWLVFGVTRLFGLSPAVIRSPSVVSGLALVVLCSWFAWRLSRCGSAAVLAGFLAAIDPNFVFYSSEARPYALVQLLGLVGAWSLSEWLVSPIRNPLMFPLADFGERVRVKGIQEAKSYSVDVTLGGELPDVNEVLKRLPIIIWIVTTALMFYLHYTSMFAVIAQMILGSLVCVRFKALRKSWFIASLIVILACLPGLFTVARLYQHADDWTGFSSFASLAHSLRFAFLFYTLPFLLCLVWYWTNRRSIPNPFASRGVILFSVFALGLAAIAVVTAIQLAPLGHYRYAIAVTGLGPVIGASCLVQIRDRFTRLSIAALIAILSLSQTSLGENLGYGMLQPPMRFERWAQIVLLINQESRGSDDPVIVFPNLIEDHRMADAATYPRWSYFWAPLDVFNQLEGKRMVFALPTWAAERFDRSCIHRIEAAGGVWLVVRGGRDGETSELGLETSIISELRSALAPSRAKVEIHRFGPPQSDVQLIWAEVSAGD